MNEQDWHAPRDEMPPEGLVVDTLNSHGQLTQLKWQSKLWWFADGSMYVYYEPTFWRKAVGAIPTPSHKGGENVNMEV